MALTVLCLKCKKHCLEQVQSESLRGVVLGLWKDHCVETYIFFLFARPAVLCFFFFFFFFLIFFFCIAHSLYLSIFYLFIFLHRFFSHPPTSPPASISVLGGRQTSHHPTIPPASTLILLGLFH